MACVISAGFGKHATNRAAALCLILIGLCLAKSALANDTVYYYYNDAQGSPVAVTDASGNVIERTQYAPYGQVLNRPEHDGPGYTKHEEDAATGLTNMQQRYDDKAIGRMLSMDPIDVDPTTGASFNRYAYANDNPYRYTDPTGMCTGSLTDHCDSENLKVIQVSEPSAPTSKIAHQMVSNNPADRVSAAHSAMNYFGIKPDKATKSLDIKYDANFRDYGKTQLVNNQPGAGEVTLGPKAYTTWSHLGSTLGHEIEVHWNMQFLPFGNFRGSHELDVREAAAYKYNLKNARRFGNTASEVQEFQDLYNRYDAAKHAPDEIYTQ